HGIKEMQSACRTHLAGGYILLRAKRVTKQSQLAPRDQRDAIGLPYTLGRRLFFIMQTVAAICRAARGLQRNKGLCANLFRLFRVFPAPESVRVIVWY
ncbi:MAG: hypothetical protein ACLTN1_07860, partial [Acutalibacteraceae bacterium]